MVPLLHKSKLNTPDENFNSKNEEMFNMDDEDAKEIVDRHGVDIDKAKRIKVLMDEEYLNEDEAAELAHEQ